jgi:membrane protein DedA with SNARE-associated domain
MFASSEAILLQLQGNGLLLLFPLAILEGPIVSVLAGWLVHLGFLAFGLSFLVLVVADLVGDVLVYYLGQRFFGLLSAKWKRRLGLTAGRVAKAEEHFRKHGRMTLVIAKITHSFGFAALATAGMTRMPMPAFLLYNTIATIPKTLLFLTIGYFIGNSHLLLDSWIGRGSLVIFLLGSLVFIILWFKKRRHSK